MALTNAPRTAAKNAQTCNLLGLNHSNYCAAHWPYYAIVSAATEPKHVAGQLLGPDQVVAGVAELKPA